MPGQTVAVIPGFGEGAWHQKRLLNAFEKLGYIAEADAAQADIIIAHSAGCFYLPKVRPQQQVVLIGPPYWPGRSVLSSFIRKGHHDIIANFHRGTLWFWLR